jgi:hypothetical protein
MSEGTVAIIGASRDRSKFGNKAVRAYVMQGWIVYPVNPRDKEIEGLRTYPSIRDVPRPINRVSIYLPPGIVLEMLDDIAAVTADEVFFNPGTDSPEVLARAEKLKLNAIVACSIVDVGMSPSQIPSQ